MIRLEKLGATYWIRMEVEWSGKGGGTVFSNIFFFKAAVLFKAQKGGRMVKGEAVLVFLRFRFLF